MPPKKQKSELDKAHARAAAGKGVPGLKAAANKIPKRKPAKETNSKLAAAQKKVASTPVAKAKASSGRKVEGINPSIYPGGKAPKVKSAKFVMGKPAKKEKSQDPPRLFPKK